MIGQGVGHRPAAGRDQKKCKFEAAFESMQRAGPAAAAGSGGGGGGAAAQGKGKREASAADAEEERRKRERVEFLLQMVCWGPD
ncbi:hypothetical protein NL676_024189 [Syzygium grande]|nr:hypothetical protein NL676_024189 [Syzygium grande]